MGQVDIYPPSQPSGMALAYAEATANQGSITTEVDLVGLTATVTVPAGRRIRIATKANFQSTIADDRAGLRIYEGATLLNEGTQTVRTANQDETIFTEAIITPSAGTHTYKLRGLRVTGTGTLTLTCGSTFPAFIVIEDITGTIYPAGTLVTAGIIASEPWTTWNAVVTQSNTPTQTLNRATYYKIGRLVFALFNISFTAAGTATNAIRITNLPVAPATNSSVSGTAHYFDTGNTNFLLMPEFDSSTTVVFERDGFGNLFGVGDITIASGDSFNGMIIYEAVS